MLRNAKTNKQRSQENEKKLSTKSARDVQSRLARALKILNKEEVTFDSIALLEEKEDFKCLSISVKSQLRRSIRLYCEYSGKSK